MTQSKRTIKVTVDKSHLLTLGERMYVESIELIRELVNNSYDADAQEVFVTITPEAVVIEDDGGGMDERGLAQFFTVGSEEKRVRSVSPRFGRKRIGQFGIGKFAALAAADRFSVESRKGAWVYAVTFDREQWQQSDDWELPVTREPATPLHHEGTKVTLTKLKRRFAISDIDRVLKESVPLRAKRFSVFLNGKRISARFIPGRRFPISVRTMYGLIQGEIVLAVKPDLVEKPGIECRVKQVLIRREFFGVDKPHLPGLNRLAGEVNADFLPIIGNREDFVRDSEEFKLFERIMRRQLEKILGELKKESEFKNFKKIQAELNDALQKIRHALALHPELTPSGRTVARRQKLHGELAASTAAAPPKPAEAAPATISSSGESKNSDAPTPSDQEPEKKPPLNLPKPTVIKRIRLKQLGLSVAIVPLGPDGPEILSQGNLLYVNSDHSLYRKFYQHREQLELHLLRLMTQEIVMMKKVRLSAPEAFAWQSQLLTEAFSESETR
ncbi:MAG: ATP-binding protein [Patescibacteria group bacterium]